MLNKELEASLNAAFARAREKRHEFMTVEHLLLALLDNVSAREALLACRADVDALRKELESFIEQTTPLIPPGDDSRETQPTLSFQRVLQRAVFHVQSSGRSEVSGANVLVAIFSEQESHAAYLLKKNDISRLDVVNFISHGTAKESPKEQNQRVDLSSEDSSAEGNEDRLENFATNLNQLARVGGIDPLIDATKSWSAQFRSYAAAVRITRCWWVKQAWAKQPLLRVLPGESLKQRARYYRQLCHLLFGYWFTAGRYQIPW